MSNRGFTLIELSVSLGILSVLATGAFLLISLEVDSSRQSETMAKLLMLKRSIIGDARIVTKESRTDFGFVGDMGTLPNSIENLWIKGSQPAFAYDNAKKAGAGWAGPYVQLGVLEFASQLPLDSWGNAIQYVVQTGTSSVTGQEYLGKVFSYGPDGDLGGGDDITTEIYTTEVLSKVASYVRDSSGNPMANIPVKMNHPSNGVLTTSSAISGPDGYYEFPGIPFGNRSITVEPKLVYSSGSAVTRGGAEDDVEFVVISFTCGSITSATVTIGDNPLTAPFFEQFRVGNTTVFNGATPNPDNLAGTNELIDFNPDPDISWSGCGGGGTGLEHVFPIRIQSPFTQAPDQDIGIGASAGKTFRIRMNNFETLEDGTGSSVNMTGISFIVTFSNGAVATFSPVPD
jgi:prepilin-type N-terminal cleavage/methylation domain-containing protein